MTNPTATPDVNECRYYEIGDRPAKWDGLKYPVVTGMDGKERPVDDLVEFFHEATEISAAQYEALVSRQDAKPKPRKEPTHLASIDDLKDPKAQQEFRDSLVERIAQEVEAIQAKNEASK